jgi:hypothetical protein
MSVAIGKLSCKPSRKTLYFLILTFNVVSGDHPFFWAKNCLKATQKRVSDKLVEKMGHKFKFFCLMRLLPSGKIAILSPSLNPKSPIAFL